jgi:hypothetical protein
MAEVIRFTQHVGDCLPGDRITIEDGDKYILVGPSYLDEDRWIYCTKMDYSNYHMTRNTIVQHLGGIDYRIVA